MYHTFSPFLIIANLFSNLRNNLIYGTLAKSHKGKPLITRQHHTGNYLRRAPLCPVRESEGETRCKLAVITAFILCPVQCSFCPVMCRAASCFLLFSLCLLLPFVLNCAAKVQRYLQTCKHFPEKVCIFNLLQQIKLIYAVFIHILSTKLAKCAIYKANIFAFRLITYVHYIITNNNAIFVAVRSVLLCGILYPY